MGNSRVLVLGMLFFTALMLVPVGSQQAYGGGFGDVIIDIGIDIIVGQTCTKNNQNCDNGNECTNDVCVLGPLGLVGVCTHAREALNGEDCDNGRQCKENGKCFWSACLEDDKPDETSCGSSADDVCKNPDECVSGKCERNDEPFGTFCDDGDECRGLGICGLAGNCLPGEANREGLPCGDSTDNQCLNPDFCVSGFCFKNDEPFFTLCDAPSGKECIGDVGRCTVGTIFNPKHCENIGLAINEGLDCGGDAGLPTECSNQDKCTLGFCLPKNKLPTETCNDDNNCTSLDRCNGLGDCLGVPDPNKFGAACNGSGTECTNQDTCNLVGDCIDNGFKPDTTTCGDDGTECTNQDTCDGSGTCDDNGFKPIATACGDGTDTICDNPDTCDGIGACANNFEPDTTECRTESGVCDVADFCDGLGACDPDAFEPAGTVCSCNAGAGECDGNNVCIGFVSIVVGPEDGPACTKSDGKGVIPVVIYGSADLDVTLIDPATIELDGQPVVTKKNGTLQVNIEDTNNDGFDDLEVKFEDNELYSTEDTMVEMTGLLLDGQPILGIADICVK